MKTTTCILAAALLPASVAAQQDPVERLAEVLPSDVTAQVLGRIEAAGDHGLPTQAVASLALEGVAKGRSGAAVLAAVDALVAEMGLAHDALLQAGHAPRQGEIEAATAAMRMGVDGAEIRALAADVSSGRTLAVALLVMGGLVERGLPSDQALALVRARLADPMSDAAFADEELAPPAGLRPDMVGLALASGMSGLQVPVAGVHVPPGPQSENGRGPPPGRGPG